MSHYSHKLWRALALVLILGLGLVALGTLTASAANITVTPGNPQGWLSSDNTGGGSSKITTTAPRSGNGSVEMRGDKTRWRKGVTPPAKLGDLYDVTHFAFDWMVANDSVSGLGLDQTPALRLHVYDPDSLKYSELIWEGAYNGPVSVTKGNWVSTDMIASNQKLWRWVTGSGVTLKNGSQVNQALGAWQDSEWYSANAYVFAVSAGVGSSAGTGYHAFADNVVLGFSNAPDTYNFEPNPPCTMVCYVNTATGNDANSGSYANDAKKTIQAAVNQVSAGGTVIVAQGVYSENVVIPKSLTLTGNGQQDNNPGTRLDGTSAAAGPGIYINAGVKNVKIEKLRVKNYNQNNGQSAGIWANGGNDGLVVQNVTADNNGWAGFSTAGIYANGPVDNVLIDKVTATNNKTRGIVIWNGFKTNITITNNTVKSNNCCGIELQDGTASGVTVTGNTVESNTDSGMAFTGLMAGAGPNLIANNTVKNNGRFGIEIKLPNGTGAPSGDGSIVVENNTVSLTSTPADLRDYAGIAVFRRGWSNVNANIPTGVIVRNNTVSGYVQNNVGSNSTGFGIVVEGTNMTATGNTLNNNDVGVQAQAGHLPYTPNTNIDGDQSNLADDYFGRGNSPQTCANIGGNTFSGNGVDTRFVGNGVGGLVTNIDTGETFCTIQAAIDDSDTVNGHTIQVSPGTYAENVVVNKSVTLASTNGRDNTTIQLQGAGGNMKIQAPNVTVDGFTVAASPAVSCPTATQSNIYVYLAADNASIVNNRIKVGDGCSKTDYGVGIITIGSNDATPPISTLLVEDNIFEPVATAGTRAFYINPGVGDFTFRGNTITGEFLSVSLSEAQYSLIKDNVVTGTGSSAGLALWGQKGAGVWGTGTFVGNNISGTANAISLYDTETVTVTHNILNGNGNGVRVLNYTLAAFDQSTIHINNNALTNNTGEGIVNMLDPNVFGVVDGTCNWWGAADGPGPVGLGSGDKVSQYVDYHGWLTSSNLNGVCSAPAPAPVGNGKIVFTAWNSGGKSDVFVMDNNSFNEVNLTNSAGNNDFDPVWSPDGTQIAFTSDRDGNNEIYVMNADGTGVVRLTNEPGNDAQPAWSPDGTKLLFISNRDGNNEVWVMNADGTGATQLTHTASPVTHKNPTWKPDGSRIAYTSNKDTVPTDARLDEIYLANPDGTGEVRLTTTPNSVTNPYYSRKPDWSPDGSKILFFSRRTASNKDIIYTMLDNGTVEPAQTPVNLSGASPRANAHGRWAPDGSRIVFTSCRDDYGVSPNWNSCGDGGNHEIYVMNADGSNQTRLTHNLLRLDDSPDWQAIPQVIPAATCTTDCYVDPNGSDANSGASAALPLKSIQLAIDTVNAGGTVHFAAGNYFENSYFGWVELTATKSIKLLGAGSGQSIIQLPVHKTNGLSIDGTGLNIDIEGLTFTHRAPGTLASGFNIRIGETNAANAEVTFTDVESAYATGRNALLEDKGTYDSVTVTNSNFHHANAMGFSITGEAKDIIVTGSHFDDNGTSSSSIAFGFLLEVADGANHIRLSNSTFNNNNSNNPTRSLGISLTHVSDVVIDNIEASNNVTGLSIPEWLAASSNIEIKNSTMNGNIVGIYLDALAGYTIDNVSIHHNDLTGNTWYGVNVFNSSRLTNLAINRNDVSGNTLGGINANNLSSYTVNGTCNWWGDMSGPGPVGPGSGSNVSNKVDFGPWLRESNLDSYLVTNTDTGKVFCGIQQAIDDGDTDDGDTITVSGGWASPYSELVDVYKSVHLTGDGAATTTIEATPAVNNNNEKAVIQVRNGKSAEITGFKIAGPGPDACGSILTGIFVHGGATANIHHNTITAIRDNDPNSACQNGLGILVGRKSTPTTGTANVTDNEIAGYQKGGIVVDNTGSSVTLGSNTITGSGSNNHVAQNGVQISRGATATLTGNDISLHQFSGSGWLATGVLLYDAGNVTINGDNWIHHNGYGIYILSTGARSSAADGPQPVPFDAEFDDLMNQGRSADAITAGTAVINNNQIYGNMVYGAFATGISGVNGRCNWWGNAGGPSGGDQVNANILYDPFRTSNNMNDSCALRLGDSGTAKWTLFLPITR